MSFAEVNTTPAVPPFLSDTFTRVNGTTLGTPVSPDSGSALPYAYSGGTSTTAGITSHIAHLGDTLAYVNCGTPDVDISATLVTASTTGVQLCLAYSLAHGGIVVQFANGSNPSQASVTYVTDPNGTPVYETVADVLQMPHNLTQGDVVRARYRSKGAVLEVFVNDMLISTHQLHDTGDNNPNSPHTWQPPVGTLAGIKNTNSSNPVTLSKLVIKPIAQEYLYGASDSAAFIPPLPVVAQ